MTYYVTRNTSATLERADLLYSLGAVHVLTTFEHVLRVVGLSDYMYGTSIRVAYMYLHVLGNS